MRRIWGILIAGLVASCSAEPTARDGGTGDARRCVADGDCDDGMFCNGVERCMPSSTHADARGCAPDVRGAPCVTGQSCDEPSMHCITDCATTRDADADGALATECGGQDCDDSDPSRAPGRPEVCDVDAHDEDCDPSTFGFRDADGDGVGDASCCNREGSVMHCGDDCDDTRPGVGPTSPEVCNGIDDDCDGATDESVQVPLFVDGDGDGFGRSPSTMSGCAASAGLSAMGGDCDDVVADVHPGAVEACNGRNDDCDTGTDEAPASTCALPGAASTQCTGGACVVTSCTGTLADCDGVSTNGCETNLSEDAMHCGDCATPCGSAGVEHCSGGTCIVDVCSAGHHLCGTTCVADADGSACGAACVACNTSDGTPPSCRLGTCSADCGSPGPSDDARWRVVTTGTSSRCVFDDAALASLVTSIGTLAPTFAPDVLDYAIELSSFETSFVLTATSGAPAGRAQIRIDGTLVASGAGYTVTVPRGRSTVTVTVTAESGTTRSYVLAVHRGSQLFEYVKAPAASMDLNFGTVVASDPDTGDLLVGAGAPFLEQRVFYVQRSGATYLAPVALPLPTDHFYSIAIAGDWIAVGDPGTLITDIPVVRMLHREATGWVEVTQIHYPGSMTYSGFGGTVAMNGYTLAVTASFDQTVYVFRSSGSSWFWEGTLSVPSTDVGDQFGASLAVAQVGTDRVVVVGAPGEDSAARGIDGDQSDDSAADSGAAYVFARPNGTGFWHLAAYLKPQNTGAGDAFGTSVAVTSTGGLDGRVVVGAPGEDSDGRGIDPAGDGADDRAPDSGAAYAFDYPATTGVWRRAAYLKASNSEAGDAFGSAVSAYIEFVGIGAPGEDGGVGGADGDGMSNSQYDSGAVYLFQAIGAWVATGYVKHPSPTATDGFGAHLASSGPLAIAAALEDSGAVGIGGDPTDDSVRDCGALLIYSY